MIVVDFIGDFIVGKIDGLGGCGFSRSSFGIDGLFMFSDSEFELYAKTLQLPAPAVELLRAVRVNPAVRRVESHVGNSIVRYPSKKMGFVIECESGRAEFVSVLEMENDPDVLEYFPQPTKLELRYTSKSGRPVVVEHTPDFLVLRSNGVEFRECKTVDGVQKLVDKQPGRYAVREGRWDCLPGVVAAKVHGFSYKVWTPAELPKPLAANFRYLDPHYKRSQDAYAVSEYSAVIAYVESHQGVTLDVLCEYVGIDGPALVRWMIAQNHLFCDLRGTLVADSDKLKLYSTPAVFQAAKNFEHPVTGWPSVLAGKNIPAGQESSPLSFAYMNYGTSAFEEANRRLACIEGRASALSVSARTIRDWKKSQERATTKYGNGYLGLLPRTADQGNRMPRLADAVYELADEVIKDRFMVTAGMKKASAYRCFVARCEELGLKSPSHMWFYDRVNSIEKGKVVLARQGPRAAYPWLGGERGQVGSHDVHGDYPLQVVHIDHTELDIELRAANGDLVLGRPWLTVAFDAASRSVLGFYLTFDSPSTASVMMVLRDVVHRHNLLPLGLTVDNGAEFHSEWFETFTALHNILVWRRPPHRARFGALIENFFGVSNSQLIHTLEGNTQLTKNVRQVSKGVNPKRLAIWTLKSLVDVFEEYVFEHFNKRVHADLCQSPADAFKALLAKHGVSVLRKQEFNDAFLISTLVSVSGKTARVQRGRGVKVHGDYFWNQLLADFVGKDVAVRFDPMDASRVFAELNGKWVACLSKYAERIAGLSARDVKVWSSELRKRNGAASRVSGPARAQLGRFIEDIKRGERDTHAKQCRAQHHAQHISGFDMVLRMTAAFQH